MHFTSVHHFHPFVFLPRCSNSANPASSGANLFVRSHLHLALSFHILTRVHLPGVLVFHHFVFPLPSVDSGDLVSLIVGL
jgi:hypothetical protein